MSKRPLLYIYQPKEEDIEAKNQSYYYMRKIVDLREKKQEREGDQVNISINHQVMEEHHEELEAVDEKDKDKDKSFSEMTIKERLLYIQSFNKTFNPMIEIEADEVAYIGSLKKLEKGVVVLHTQSPPYMIELDLDDITSVRIRSF